jgi:hypothetical protein
MIDPDDVPLTQKRGETSLVTVQQAGLKAATTRGSPTRPDFHDVRDIKGLPVSDIFSEYCFISLCFLGATPSPAVLFKRPPMDYDSYDGVHPKPLMIHRERVRNAVLDVTDIEVSQHS